MKINGRSGCIFIIPLRNMRRILTAWMNCNTGKRSGAWICFREMTREKKFWSFPLIREAVHSILTFQANKKCPLNSDKGRLCSWTGLKNKNWIEAGEKGLADFVVLTGTVQNRQSLFCLPGKWQILCLQYRQIKTLCKYVTLIKRKIKTYPAGPGK